MADKPKYYNEARNRASQKYNSANLEQVNFRVRKGEKAILQEEAEQRRMSMAQFIVTAVNSFVGKQVLTPPKANDSKDNIASNINAADKSSSPEAVPDEP